MYKRLFMLFCVCSLVVFITYVVFVTMVQADISDTVVYVCTGSGGDYPCTAEPYGPISYENNYIPQVLANEWAGASEQESLKAGAIVIRTFGWRQPGCGAISHFKTVGTTEYRVENDLSQRYWLPDGTQNPILPKHTHAVTFTADVTLRRGGDYAAACAKYKADCGNPTGIGLEEDWTLWGVADPVDSITTIHLSGMSQNGTHAWELNDYADAAPLGYRQMLTHYYAYVTFVGAPSVYRWTWLDVDTSQMRYGEYYGSKTHTPRTMLTGRKYAVPFHIQNTGTITWNISGLYSKYLSYHWYDQHGTNLVMGDGLYTSPGVELGPTQHTSVEATVVAPFNPGVYTLKWDMVLADLLWFSEQYDGWPTQDVTVTVQASPDLEVLPCVSNRDNWHSTISIHNPSATEWLSVDVSYITLQNDIVSVTSYDVGPNSTLSATPPDGFWGMAVIGASHDIEASVYPTCNQLFLSMVVRGEATK